MNNSSTATPESNSGLVLEELTPWPQEVNIELVADDIANLIKQHCVLEENQINAITLWILSSYLINSFRTFPLLTLISPEKRCGKTTTMELIHTHCHKGMHTSNMTAAVIFRLIAKSQPTLLLDEADTYLKNATSDFVGIINSAHVRSAAHIYRCTGDNSDPTQYSTWAPFVLASIGSLNGTIMDRSIVINLKRKTDTDTVKRIPGDLFKQRLNIRQKILRWTQDNKKAIEQYSVEPPDLGNDRAKDCWFPLFAVATNISDKWKDKCLDAYNALTEESEKELSTQLLEDIKQIIDSDPKGKYPSAVLIDLLCNDSDKPWLTANKGGKITPHMMGRLLAPYGIKPKALRIGSSSLRGYHTEDFKDALRRYVK